LFNNRNNHSIIKNKTRDIGRCFLIGNIIKGVIINTIVPSKTEGKKETYIKTWLGP
jgi:hypothetical protein